MSFLGIDQSLRSTGLAVLGQDNVPLVLCRVETKKLRQAARLATIRDTVIKLLVDHQPDVVAMEGYSYNSTGTVFELGELGGVMKLLLYDYHRRLIIVAPTSLKKFISGSGDASEKLLNDSVKVKWKQDIPQDDMRDAYGLAQVARAFHLEKGATRAELEVVHLLRNPEKKIRLVSASTHKLST